MLDKDRLLRTFVAVARAGSLRGASYALGLTQPAVSKQIGALEGLLGSPLFERHGRGMRLTAIGQRLVEQAGPGLELVDAALDGARHAGSRTQGIVAIATVNTLAAYLVPDVVAALRAEHPQLAVGVLNASSPDVVERVARGLADIGLVYDLAVDTDAVLLQRLRREQVCAYGREADRLPARLTAAQLAAHALIVPPRPYALRRVIERELPAPLAIAAESNSVSVSLDLVMKGVGLAVLPSELPETAVKARGLRRIEIDGAALDRHVVLIRRKSGGAPSEAVAVTLRAIEARVAALA